LAAVFYICDQSTQSWMNELLFMTAGDFFDQFNTASSVKTFESFIFPALKRDIKNEKIYFTFCNACSFFYSNY